MPLATALELALRFGPTFVTEVLALFQKKDTVTLDEWSGLVAKISVKFDDLVPVAKT